MELKDKESFLIEYRRNHKIKDFYADPNILNEDAVFLGEVLSFAIDRLSLFQKYIYTYRFIIKPVHHNEEIGVFQALWIRNEDNRTCCASRHTFSYEEIFTWDYKKATALLRKYSRYQMKAFKERL